jgi:alpha-glucoside transport system permease protein
VSGGNITAAPPTLPEGPPALEGSGQFRRYATAAAFLAPAVVLLGVWIVYPTIYTFIRSFFGQSGFDSFVGIDNYKTLFTTDRLLTAIKNSAIWVGIVPAFVTAIGLIFAVLTERVRWSVAFKTVVFMPMAISAFATAVTWRIMYEQDPNQGAVNAVIAVADNAINPPGVLPDAQPSQPDVSGSPKGGLVLQTPLQAGSVARIGLTGIATGDVPGGAVQAQLPSSRPGSVVGVVWRDFKPGGGTPGQVEQGELGLPGVTLQLRDANGKTVATTTSGPNGDFTFDQVGSGTFRAAVAPKTFEKPFGGVGWLAPRLITFAMIFAYIWIWAGFAMVVIAAGLSAMPRDVLEAARTDGATEWQVFRRVTVPLLGPVLSVVFITMIINVLKVFDIVITLAPGSSQNAGNVIALAMWRESFGGVNDFGVGSAIAVFLFVLVIPVLLLNIRNFRREA